MEEESISKIKLKYIFLGFLSTTIYYLLARVPAYCKREPLQKDKGGWFSGEILANTFPRDLWALKLPHKRRRILFLTGNYINCSIRLAFYNNLSLFVFKFDRCLNKVRQDTIFSFPLDDRILCVVKLTWHFSPIL